MGENTSSETVQVQNPEALIAKWKERDDTENPLNFTAIAVLWSFTWQMCPWGSEPDVKLLWNCTKDEAKNEVFSVTLR